MRRRRAMAMDMVVAVPIGVGMMFVGLGLCEGHLRKTLHYNITRVHQGTSHGLPITIAMAAARNGNGTETAARNQTKRAGMNGISHRITRWKANSAQATT
jgi:hypothetical protein